MAEAVDPIPPQQDDGLPVVAGKKPGNLGLLLFMGALLAGGFWVFSLMSANRAEITMPSTTAVAADPSARISSPPPLALPREFLGFAEREPGLALNARRTLPPAPVRVVQTASPSAPAARSSSSVAVAPPSGIETEPSPPRPAVVFDSDFTPTPAQIVQDNTDTGRIMAGRFANPARTIMQGTVIPAVLETALDSTKPGAARALVQRDIYGFDGTRVLIHRGSRLYGEYSAELAQGQNRALIQWTRLIRPDGVTIALDSPSADPLGRAGVRGKVDSKFLQRFGGALLQSVLDIGVGIATREATDGVVVALPGSTQNVQVTQQQQIQPTLKVKHGTSVSVFVARDLDFSTVEF